MAKDLVEIDLDDLFHMNYCPYCGSYLMYFYLGDWLGYTTCDDCDKELEIILKSR